MPCGGIREWGFCGLLLCGADCDGREQPQQAERFDRAHNPQTAYLHLRQPRLSELWIERSLDSPEKLLYGWSRRRRGWGWRGWCRRRRSRVVDQVLQLFAGLEKGNLLGGDVHALTGLRIAPHARLALPRPETAKAADLNLVASAQRAHHAVKDRFHDHFTIFPRKFCQTRHFVNQIGFGHIAPLCAQQLELLRQFVSHPRASLLAGMRNHS